MSVLRLVSPHPREDCVRRLRDGIVPWWRRDRPDAPRGFVGETWATLRTPFRGRDSFKTVLRVSLKDNPQGGTDLLYRASINRFVAIFVVGWFAGVLSACSMVLLPQFFPSVHDSGASAWPGGLIPFAMLAFGIGVVVAGRYRARFEARELTDVLEQTLDARPA